jgi:chaperonin GroEL (HSP60 family)
MENCMSVGGGALEAQLYLVLQELALAESDIVTQLCISAWSEALLTIPSTIAENAGFSVDLTLQLVREFSILFLMNSFRIGI